MKRLPLITTFILFIALCVSAAYWAMQMLQPPMRAVVAPPRVFQPAPGPDAAAGLLGGHTTAVAAGNYQLKGVIISSDPAESVAILSFNGKPAQAVRTNAEIAHDVTLKEVNRRYVLLSEGGAVKKIELPEGAKAKMKAGQSAEITGRLP